MSNNEKFNYISSAMWQMLNDCKDESGVPSILLAYEFLRNDPYAFRIIDSNFIELANWAYRVVKPSQKKEYADMLAFVRMLAEIQKKEIARDISEGEEELNKVKKWIAANQA
jgi:hypothetical protein